MFDIDRYFEHLGYTGGRERSADNLRELHKKHMMTVPFDNSRNAPKGLAIWDDVDAGVDAFHEALIVEGRGGICHEHSGLFRGALLELGYDVSIVSAGVRGANDQFGPDLEHMMNVVRLDGEQWLVDVGFAGPSFIEPVRISPEVQSQYGFDYRVVESGDYLVLERRTRAKDWHAVYRFTLTERKLTEWKAIASGENDDPVWHWAGEMIAAGTLIYGRAYDNGQLLLVGRRYLRAEDGQEHVRVLAKTDEYQAVIRNVLLQDA
ncbi:arylamine N-acetyltransferase family protein [Micromonospora cathayae]|uniref:Arylamine N-acetyltransferase n=1 Tax=Micromonospora cathayae TaxID=3028804 RepID=A0ABY7ZXC4_9ACTN|nr:arylamine N-acetyltransferase [Micromonospora sp. HUAS 3]WDZ86549.1 arylamine N-acetyltransferase [Micromonospora sp. HUAS 3]